MIKSLSWKYRKKSPCKKVPFFPLLFSQLLTGGKIAELSSDGRIVWPILLVQDGKKKLVGDENYKPSQVYLNLVILVRIKKNLFFSI